MHRKKNTLNTKTLFFLNAYVISYLNTAAIDSKRCDGHFKQKVAQKYINI